MANEKELIMKFKVDTTDLVKTQAALKQTGATAATVKQQVEAITGQKYGDFVKNVINSDSAKNIAADRADRTRTAISRATSGRSAQDIAYERINAQRQQKEIRDQMREIDPTSVPTKRIGGRLGSLVKGLTGVAAVSALGRGISTQLQKQALDPQNYSAGQGVTDTLKGLPGLGGVVDFVESMSPSVRARRAGEAGISRMNERAEMMGNIAGIRRAGIGQLDDVTNQARAARGEAIGAGAFANDIAKNGAGRFITENIAGVSSSAQGEAKMALAQAQANAVGTGTVAAEATAARQAQQARRDAAQAAADAAERAAGGAVGRSNAAKGNAADANARTAGGITGSYNTIDDAKDVAAKSGEAAKKIAEARQKQLDLAKEDEQLQKRINEEAEANKKNAQARYEIGKAQVDVLKAQLDVVKEQIEIQKGGARALGGMDESKRQDLVEAAKTLQKDGIGGLSDDEKDLLRQDPRTAKLLEKQQEKEGLASPENAQINALYEAGGFNGQGLEEAKAEAQKLQEEIIKQNAELNKTFKEAMAQTISDQLKQLTDAVAQAMKSAIEAAIKDMEGKKFVEKNTTSQ